MERKAEASVVRDPEEEAALASLLRREKARLRREGEVAMLRRERAADATARELAAGHSDGSDGSVVDEVGACVCGGCGLDEHDADA
eukprot:2093637-Prymnesium_polylepis.1